MEEKAKEILLKSVDLFMKYGIKSVTMDDIAKEMKISKKTLYKYFPNKNQLVKAAVEADCKQEECEIEMILSKKGNAIDHIIDIAKMVSVRLREIHPSIIYDMEKYYPEAWELMDVRHKEHVFGQIQNNLSQGINEGLYRNNLNVEVIARLFSEKILTIIDGRTFSPQKYSFLDVYIEMMRYHIRGIASEKGIKYLNKKIQQDNLKL